MTAAGPSAGLQVRFWGVRGSIPAPGPDTARYGGNTPCVEIVTPALRESAAALVLDAGSGLRALGLDLLARPVPPKLIHLVFSHLHWDHLQGLPFFAPLFLADATVMLHSMRPPSQLEQALAVQMSAPYYPLPLDATGATRRCAAIPPAGLTIADVTISAFPLRHPQGCSGFRLESGGRVVVYATDFEYGDAACDGVLAARAAAADVLVCDAQYTDDEEAAHRGWGHSTWRQATTVAREAGVGRLVLFHHDPLRTDAALDAIVTAARERFPHTDSAREGECITL